MEHTAKLVTHGRSQDADSGEVRLSPKPTTWDGFLAALATADVPADFLDPAERHEDPQSSDDSPAPLDGLAL
jgi:hypothetical protein